MPAPTRFPPRLFTQILGLLLVVVAGAFLLDGGLLPALVFGALGHKLIVGATRTSPYRRPF